MSEFNYNQTERVEQVSTFEVLMRSVYTWMAVGLGLTALTAYLVAASPSLVIAIVTSRLLFWGLCIAEFALVVWLSARIWKMSYTQAMLLFLAYAVVNGLTLSVIFLAYSGAVIAETFLITAGTFGGMSLLGYFTKTDLSTFGRIMRMALLGLIIATLVNLFMQNDALMSIINYIGVAIFIGLTAYDTQKIKNMLQIYSDAGINDQNKKIALMGSLSLYLDFVNLFLYILRIFGGRK